MYLKGLLLIIGQQWLLTSAFEESGHWYRHGNKELNEAKAKKPIEHRAKNVILFIGDGMGVITHTLARIYKGQLKGVSGEEGELFWEKFPYSGLIKTYNTDHQVPDSAGTATAIMSGVKTSLGVLGVDAKVKYNQCDKNELQAGTIDSIKDWAVNSKKKVGIISTARITHATPGAVYAHTPSRDWESDSDIPDQYKGCVKDIASQLVDNLVDAKVEFALGGGARSFLPTSLGGRRTDNKNLIEELKRKNIQVFRNTGDLRRWDKKSQAIGLFGNDHMDYDHERKKSDEGQPSIEEMTRQAVNRLKNHQEGYFLMVESGRIDHGHHINQAKKALHETVQLEKAVKVAAALTSEEDTLILVTADHSHAVTMSGYQKRGNDVLGVVYEEPGNMNKFRFMVTKDNKTQPYQTISYANGPGFYKHFDREASDWRNISQFDTGAWNYTQPATYWLPYETHGGEDVSVFARGPYAHYVTGLHEQSYIGALMAYASCTHQKQFGCPAEASSVQAVQSSFTVILVSCAIVINNWF